MGIIYPIDLFSLGSLFSHCRPCAICAHTVAVAYKVGKPEEFVASYEVSIGQMVQAGIPGRSGMKDIERARKQKRAGNPPRDVSQYGERVEARQVSSGVSSLYELVFVKDTSATTCYGCKGRVRERPSAPPPPSPYDLFRDQSI